MKSKKLISYLIIAVFMISALWCSPVLADGDYTLAFSVNSDDETVTVTGFDGAAPELEYNLIIPRTMRANGKVYRVTAIGNNAFSYAKKSELMQSVTFPSTLEQIGNSAFSNNGAIVNLRFPSSLKSIGQLAFMGCSKLTDVGVFPEGIRLGVRCFDNDGYLQMRREDGQHVFVPGSGQIDNSVFKSARLYRVIIGEGLTALPSEMFYDIPTIRVAALPSTCTTLSAQSFGSRGANNFTNFYVLADSVTIDKSAFDPKLIGSESKTYSVTVMNDDVKQAIVNAGFNESFVNVAKAPVTIVEQSPENYSVYSDDSIVLPQPSLPGYIFKGYTDGIRTYNAGDTFDAKSVFDSGKGRIVSAIWEPDYENDNVLYKNIGNESTFEPSVISRIILPNCAGSEVQLNFTNEYGESEKFNALFDENGVWLNNGNTDKYVSVSADGIDNDEIAVLLPIQGEYFDFSLTELRKPVKLMYTRFDSVFDSDDVEYSSSNSAVATVDDKGVVTGRKSGDAVIYAKYGSRVYSLNLSVKGEIALAIESGRTAEYLAQKKPVIDALNAAISSGNAQEVISVLDGTAINNFNSINDFDSTFVDNISSDSAKMNELAERLITYGSFKYETIDDMLSIIDTVIDEIKLGELNHLSSAADVLACFKANSGYYGIDLEHEYNKSYAESVAARFVNYTAKNIKSLQYDYKQAYVMEAFADASGYTVVQTIVEKCGNEIGYDIKHFEENECADMYKQIIEKRDSITTMAQLKSFIDSYTKKSDDGSSDGKNDSSSSGSSSSSRGSSYGSKSYGFDSSYIDSTVGESTNLPQKLTIYGDISGDRWSYDAIQYLSSKNIINGYNDGYFMPQKNISRAEFIKLLMSASGLDSEISDTDSIPFADVNMSDWFAKYAVSAYKKGIAAGSGGNFAPNDEITREQIAAFLYRACVECGYDLKGVSNIEISDMQTVSDWAQTAVSSLVSAGIINGYSDGSFAPKNAATREEAAALIYRFAIGISENKGN